MSRYVNILIVAATPMEVEGLMDHFKVTYSARNPLVKLNRRIDLLITGVGMLNTSYQLTKHLGIKKEYDLILNIGVAGTFNDDFELGECVVVCNDTLSELGAEDDGSFIKAPNLIEGLVQTYKMQIPTDIDLLHYRKVTALTVNTVHGNPDNIKKCVSLYHADIETMEGAAVFMIANAEKMDCLQFRSISNYIEKRDRSKWKMKEAIENLNKETLMMLKSL